MTTHANSIAAALAKRADRIRITVGTGSCGIAAGALAVLEALRADLADEIAAGDVNVVEVGCRGLCYAEPLVEVAWPNGEAASFSNVDAPRAARIAEGVRAGAIDLDPFVEETAGQTHRVMDLAGSIGPRSIDEYRAVGGYAALKRALAMAPDDVIEAIGESGLRGRGGAGFPTGAKWRAVADAVESARESGDANAFSYFVMNGDEGDPGAYMNRSLLESDPHKVLEGLVIAAYAVRARRAYLFVRAEYPVACRTMQRAIEQAYEAGILGESVLGSGFSLDAAVVRGAGAYLTGEETALLRVLEDGACLPRRRPPYPAKAGLWGKPTCVNNVETLANVPFIVENGAEAFRSVGTPSCPGTKVFSVVGAVERGGLVEVPLGTPLRAVVDAAGGAEGAKAVQIGGPSGGILPLNDAASESTPVDYESLSASGAIMGSGGFVVIGPDQCMVDIALYFMRFSQQEACGRCRAAAEGIARCVDILDGLTHGEGAQESIDELRREAGAIAGHALCGLCKSAANVVLSALRCFPDEFAAHAQGRCPGLTCRDLISYEIDQTRCQGERCCLLTCPGNAVKGRFGTPGRIVARLCQKCGMCAVSCPYGAVRKVTPPVG